ncbi:hypothetical protein Bca52824_092598 [Brassica carinata]|uniref:Uncharacterized protein n=1 Tax=Brassica carinata TaxID=52824 RepID=A0A8X7NTL9_BRACI|nr:hypothetical protein Bca52824_092598 [Brassica carinata]
MSTHHISISSILICNAHHQNRQRFPCKAVSKATSAQAVTIRRSANYRPSLWRHEYLLSVENIYAKEVEAVEKAKLLKEEVRMTLVETQGSIEQLERIDALERLGISYHYKHEIHNILKKIHDNRHEIEKESKDLHATALEFFLLRQHGFDVSQDDFDVFKSETGVFSKNLRKNIKGLLSLYEASYFSMQSEFKLKEARTYASERLCEFVAENSKTICGNDDEAYTLEMVKRVLEKPYHWSMKRLEARWYIDVYGRRHDMDPLLLGFAELDFNMVQANHQEELKLMSSWWNSTGLMKQLDFVRDRITEKYFWSTGIFYEPEHSYYRKILTKIFMLITTMDDIYDIYGTLEELENFTDVVEKWDVNYVETLPEYMKMCFLFLYNEINQMGYDVLRDKGLNVIPYLKQVWTDLFKTFLIEAKWYKTGHKPSFEEYMQNSLISSSVPTILLHLFSVLSDHGTHQTLTDVSKNHHSVVRSSATILRLANDLATSTQEMARGDSPKSVQCYMYDTRTSEEEAREQIQIIISDSWDDINSGFNKEHTSALPPGFVAAAANLNRVVQCIYQHGDGHGCPEKAKTVDHIHSVLFNPIPF